MVKLAISGFVLAGMFIGIWLIKAGLEEMFVGVAALLSPETAIGVGIFIFALSWFRFKRKR